MDEQLAKNKNSKYFIFQGQTEKIKMPAYRHPKDPRMFIPMVYLDDRVIPNAKFYCEAMWYLPGDNPWKVNGKAPRNGVDEHTHPFGELIGFFGFNYDNIHDLGAEVELWIDGKQYILKESFVAFVPPGIKHCPLNIRNIVRPLMHLTAGPAQRYE